MKRLGMALILTILLISVSVTASAWETSGTCGENLVWKVDEKSGTLTISGTGPMDDWERRAQPGWEIGNSWYSNPIKHVVIEEGVTTIGMEAFYYSSVETISLPSTLTHICDKAFFGCNGIKEIDFSDNIISIGSNAFAGCNRISELELPKALETIEVEAFWGMESLEKVKIGPNIEYFGGVAFGGCPKLSLMEFTSDAPVFDQYAFLSMDDVTVTYPMGNVTWTKDKLQNYDGYVTWIPVAQGTCGNNVVWTLKGDVLVISGNGVMKFDPLPAAANKEYPPWFEYRLEVKEVAVKSGITGFDPRAFQHCKNMTKIMLPDTLESIGSQMFHGCDSLTSIEIPGSVTQIDAMAFKSCVSLKEIEIPESVTLIKDEAFAGCTALEEVSIMGSPKIWYACFQGCESLKTIRFYGDVPILDSMCFDGVTATAYYPAGNPTWTKDRLTNYGGKLTWKPFGCTKHSEVQDAAVAAGCLTAGKTAGAHCSKCGVVTKTQQVIPAKGHSFGAWKQTKAPTVQAAGQESRSCKNCSVVENRELPKLTQQGTTPVQPNPTDPNTTEPDGTGPNPTDPTVGETLPPTVPDEGTQPQPTEPDTTLPVTPDDAPEKGTPWLTIVIVGVLILTGGGAAAWFFVLRKRK